VLAVEKLYIDHRRISLGDRRSEHRLRQAVDGTRLALVADQDPSELNIDAYDTKEGL
jgi:hypothetical protein